MQLLSVELENIKSYRRARIPLTPGLNAVSGDNGSGKTTVLEAIGFALFDHLSYNQAAFVREGEKTGTMRVRLLAPDDREYEVVRKVGASSQYYVADVESGTRLAERGPNVQEWVRTHALGIDGEADLGALFENAVGVPQGKMTSDFLGSTGQRKAIFNPLLRVEEYERAWEGLRDTISNLKDRMGIVREDIARLTVDVDRIVALEEQAATLRAQVTESERLLQALLAEIADTEAKKEALDHLQEQVQTMQQAVQAQEYEVRRQTDWLGVHRKSLEAAQAARTVVEDSTTGYQLVLSARTKLESLDAEKRKKDELERQKDNAQHAMIHIQSVITRLDKERQQAIEDGDAAAALAPQVERQDELEAELRQAEMLVKERQRLDADLQRLEKEASELEQVNQGRERRLEEARQARGETARLAEVQRDRESVLAGVAGIDSLREQFRATREEGERLRGQHDTLLEESQRWETLTRTIAERAPAAEQVRALEEQERALREEGIRTQVALDYQNLARTELERRRCPLLELGCPVVAADEETLERFDDRLAKLTDRLGELEQEIGGLLPRLELARSSATEVQVLTVEAARLEGSKDRLSAVLTDLERCRERYAEMTTIMAQEKELRGRSTSLDKEIERLRRLEKLVSQIPIFEEQQRLDSARLAGNRAELERLRSRRAELDAATSQVRSMRDELAALGEPKPRQQRLLATAGRREGIESELVKQQKLLKEQSDRALATAAALEAFSDLEAQIAEHKQLVADNQSAYERYIQNETEAREVEARQNTVEQTEKNLAAAEAAERAARIRLEEAVSAYDPELHQITLGRHAALQQEWAGASRDHEHLEQELKEVMEELIYCRRQEERLRLQETELDGLGRTEASVRFIRDMIRQAGPTITETLLANISQIANDIYAEIMDDHAVELRWDREYEVVVRRGPEDRKFPQLSGGEQMSAALAVRLALLKEMSEVDAAFFDEPTQNMDADRRANLAEQIRQIRGFSQLIVISHDDTFEHHTDNLIRLVKEEDETRLEA